MRKLSILFAALFFSTSFAATPEPGLWNIDEELNGLPGRGFQVELQNDILVLTYFGYEEEGDATFYISSGFYNGVTFLGELLEVEGGTAIGGVFQNGEVVDTIGIVRLDFDSSTSGTIRLPNEETKAISKYAFNDPRTLFAETYEGLVYSAGIFAQDTSTYTFSFGEGNMVTIERDSYFNSTCIYSGFYELAGNGMNVSGAYECADFSSGDFVAENLTVSSLGVYTGTFTRYPENSDMAFQEIHTGM